MLVVFYHHGFKEYCSYCPEIECFNARAETIPELINLFKQEYLLWELENRFYNSNLWIRGWKISEDSVIPPIFTDEEAIKLTEKSYEIPISDYQIEKIDVEVPRAIRRRTLPGFYRHPEDIS